MAIFSTCLVWAEPWLEVPSNMVLKKLQRPSRYIPTLVVAWGAVMASHGFANDFSGLLVARLLLGTTE